MFAGSVDTRTSTPRASMRALTRSTRSSYSAFGNGASTVRTGVEADDVAESAIARLSYVIQLAGTKGDRRE
jgi:hypothetical protein